MSSSGHAVVWLLLLFALPCAILSAWAVTALPEPSATTWFLLFGSTVSVALGFWFEWRQDPHEAARFTALYLGVVFAACLLVLVSDLTHTFAIYVICATALAGAAGSVAFMRAVISARATPSPLRLRFPCGELFERDSTQLIAECSEHTLLVGQRAQLVLHLQNCTNASRRVRIWIYAEPSGGLAFTNPPLQDLLPMEIRDVLVDLQASGTSFRNQILRVGMSARGVRGKRVPMPHGRRFPNPIAPWIAPFDMLVSGGLGVDGGVRVDLSVVRSI